MGRGESGSSVFVATGGFCIIRSLKTLLCFVTSVQVPWSKQGSRSRNKWRPHLRPAGLTAGSEAAYLCVRLVVGVSLDSAVQLC